MYLIWHRQQVFSPIARSNAQSSGEAYVTSMLKVIRDALTPYAAAPSTRNRRERALSFLGANPGGNVADIGGAGPT